MNVRRRVCRANKSLFILGLVAAWSQVGRADDANQPTAAQAGADQQALFKQFEQTLNNVALIGNFTILGSQSNTLREERYEIRGVSKMPSGDYWLFQTRIKYGQHDVALPLPLQVKWAERTPVITLDNVSIPGLGTFNSRVTIDGDMYAGTWSHGKVRGHLFGRIEKLKSDSTESASDDVAN